MVIKYKTISEYIYSLSPEQKRTVRFLDTLIRKTATKLKRKLWQQKLWGGLNVSIIGYGEYGQVYNTGKKVSWFLIGLTAYKNNYSIYINAVYDKKYLAEANKKRLGKVSVGKSCIRFKKLEDLNVVVLQELVRQAHTKRIR
jgi:hypothetical protein